MINGIFPRDSLTAGIANDLPGSSMPLLMKSCEEDEEASRDTDVMPRAAAAGGFEIVAGTGAFARVAGFEGSARPGANSLSWTRLAVCDAVPDGLRTWLGTGDIRTKPAMSSNVGPFPDVSFVSFGVSAA